MGLTGEMAAERDDRFSGGRYKGNRRAIVSASRSRLYAPLLQFDTIGPVAKYAHEKNHIDRPKRAWLMWFFALELNCYEKLWNASSVYRS